MRSCQHNRPQDLLNAPQASEHLPFPTFLIGILMIGLLTLVHISEATENSLCDNSTSPSPPPNSKHKSHKAHPPPTIILCNHTAHNRTKPDYPLTDLRLYLSKYGYLRVAPRGNRTVMTELKEAIRLFQRNFGLPITRRLDAVTVAQLQQPRCGREDLLDGEPLRPLALDETKQFAFFPDGRRWRSRYDLTWSLSTTNVTQRIPRNDIRSAFDDAFAVWTAIVPSFSFTEVESYSSADVQISFPSGNHGDSQSFDGVLGVVAHAFSPEDGRLHLDDAEFWSVNVTADRASAALDLRSVAIHEVGHVLGLAHSPVRDSVMFPSIAPHRVKRRLSEDDIQGIRQLYGYPVAPVPSPQAAHRRNVTVVGGLRIHFPNIAPSIHWYFFSFTSAGCLVVCLLFTSV